MKSWKLLRLCHYTEPAQVKCLRQANWRASISGSDQLGGQFQTIDLEFGDRLATEHRAVFPQMQPRCPVLSFFLSPNHFLCVTVIVKGFFCFSFFFLVKCCQAQRSTRILPQCCMFVLHSALHQLPTSFHLSGYETPVGIPAKLCLVSLPCIQWVCVGVQLFLCMFYGSVSFCYRVKNCPAACNLCKRLLILLSIYE